MRHLRPFLLTTFLIAAPASTLFAQGAPPKSATPTKATSAPTATPAAAPAQHYTRPESEE